MAKDPRAEFMRKSNLMAAGQIVHDSAEIEEENLDLTDPRQRFIRDSMALANGMGLAGVRKLYADTLDAQDLDPRQRFIQGWQRVADGESVESVSQGRADSKKPRREFRADDRRYDRGCLFIKTDDEDDLEKKDPRSELLNKLARM